MRTIITALSLCVSLTVGLAACNGEQSTDTDDEDTDTSDSGEVDTGSTEWMPSDETLIQGNPECTAGTVKTIVPASEEVGHRAAVRLTPAVFPYEVLAVRAVLAHDTDQGCDASGEQTVEVYKGTETAPPGDWTPADVITIPAATETAEQLAEDGARIIEGYLQAPLVLAEGEHLFLAVPMAQGEAGLTCLTVCSSDADADRNYWSNATEPDYPWPTMASFGINGWFYLMAFGEEAGIDI